MFYTDEWDEAEEAALDMADNGARVTVSERRPPFDDWEPVAFAGEGRNQAWRESRSRWLEQKQAAAARSREAARRRAREQDAVWNASVAAEREVRGLARRAAGPAAAGPPGTGSRGKASRLPR
jgi:hypothetical protein